MPTNVFPMALGWLSTQSAYDAKSNIRARYDLVERLLRLNTHDAVQAARSHLMHLFRVYCNDHEAAREVISPICEWIPSVNLRAGKDQDSYDFVKWYRTTAQPLNYGWLKHEWRDKNLAFLDVKHADVFKSVDDLCDEHGNISHTVSATLLKFRLLQDVKALQKSSCIGEKLPIELVNQIQGYLVSTTVARRKDVMESQDQRSLIKRLKGQLNNLYVGVKKQNVYFWPALIQPAGHLGGWPEMDFCGKKSSIQFALRRCYASWAETPGAIEMIGAMMRDDTASYKTRWELHASVVEEG